VKTFELALGIILIVGCHVLWISRFFRREWTFRSSPSGGIVEIVLGVGMLAAGGLMLWLWSR
jgi:hypothetical protein